MQYPTSVSDEAKDLMIEPFELSTVIPNIHGLCNKINELIEKHNQLVVVLDDNTFFEDLDDDDDNVVEGETVEDATCSNDVVAENDAIFSAGDSTPNHTTRTVL